MKQKCSPLNHDIQEQRFHHARSLWEYFPVASTLFYQEVSKDKCQSSGQKHHILSI